MHESIELNIPYMNLLTNSNNFIGYYFEQYSQLKKQIEKKLVDITAHARKLGTRIFANYANAGVDLHQVFAYFLRDERNNFADFLKYTKTKVYNGWTSIVDRIGTRIKILRLETYCRL